MGRFSAAFRSRSVSREESLPDEPVGLELIGVALCLGAVLLAGALVTLGPEGEGGATRNVAGSLGHSVAGTLTRAVGLGAWVFTIIGVVWGVGCLRGRMPRAWARRALLIPLLAALVGMAGALLLRDASLPGLDRSGPGGYVGVALAKSLYGTVGRAAGLIVVVAFIGTLRLVTDVPLRHVAGKWIGLLNLGAGGTATETPVAEDEDEEWEEEEEEDEEYEEDEEEWEYEDEEEEEDEGGEDPEEVAVATPAKKPPAPRVRRPRKPRRKVSHGEYVFPPTDLLEPGTQVDPEIVRDEVETNARVLGETLASFGVEARVVSKRRGPVITFFEIAIASGIRLSRVTALADDLAIALKAPSVRIVAPIPGRSTVGVEVPNLQRDVVAFRDLVEEAHTVADQKSIPIFLGRDTAGRPIVEDLASMPHILIAGATGSGKSVCLNSVLLSMLYTRTPEELSLILIDPKQVELSFYEGIPHLITPVVTDMKRATKILEWAVDRMEERYGLLLAAGVRNIAGYNAVPKAKHEALRERTGLSEEESPDHLPHLVIVVDELADLMMTSGKDVEFSITRLAQKSRAVGIHIVLTTQRPSTNVITGLIKANMPTRIAFMVSSKIDSRVILDANGADKLLGMGDMLYMNPRSLHLRRAQGTLVTDEEARGVVDFLEEKCPAPDYRDLLQEAREGLADPMQEDDLYDDAVRVVLTTRLGSASMLQRRMSVGYTRASRLIDMMSDRGVVGPHVGSKARECLLTLEEWEAQKAEEPRPSAQWEDDEVPDTSWD